MRCCLAEDLPSPFLSTTAMFTERIRLNGITCRKLLRTPKYRDCKDAVHGLQANQSCCNNTCQPTRGVFEFGSTAFGENSEAIVVGTSALKVPVDAGSFAALPAGRGRVRRNFKEREAYRQATRFPPQFHTSQAVYNFSRVYSSNSDYCT